MKSIAILGTGPAGLMAAQACVVTGYPFTLFGKPGRDGSVQPSVISGAQFMHVAVPTVSDEDSPDMTLTYRTVGTAEGYKGKVYGNDPNVPFVSFDNIQDGMKVPAWNLKAIYERMWNGICSPDGSSVNAENVTAETLERWFHKGHFDAVVSTVPRMAICQTHAGLVDRYPHSFLSQRVHISNDEDMGISHNEIVYDGTSERSWYRSSNIAGHLSTEWSSEAPPFYAKGAAVIDKPITHTCDCWADQPLVYAGRYGKWKKGVLVQDGFVETFNLIEGLRK